MNSKIKSRPAAHDENRPKICLVHQKKKQNMKSIGREMKEKLRTVTNYNSTDERLPTNICSSCRIDVYKLTKSERSLVLPDYSKFSFQKKIRVPKLQKFVIAHCAA